MPALKSIDAGWRKTRKLCLDLGNGSVKSPISLCIPPKLFFDPPYRGAKACHQSVRGGDQQDNWSPQQVLTPVSAFGNATADDRRRL